MIELVNRNLEKTEPDYFYRVEEWVFTFEQDPGKNKPISHTQDFKQGDLLKCKVDAEKYYKEREEGMLKAGKYFLPFAGPKDFKMGENAGFSLVLSLVEYYNEDLLIEHPLLGEDEDEMAQSRETEKMVLEGKGLL